MVEDLAVAAPDLRSIPSRSASCVRNAAQIAVVFGQRSKVAHRIACALITARRRPRALEHVARHALKPILACA